MKNILTFIALALLSQSVNAQIASSVETVIRLDRFNRFDNFGTILLKETKHTDSVISEIEKYRTNDSAEIRRIAYQLLFHLATSSTDSLYKQRYVEKMVFSQFDSNGYVRNTVSEDLISIERSAFSPIALSTLGELSLPSNYRFLSSENILLAGFLKIHIPFVDSLAHCNIEYIGQKRTFDIIWSSKLCLARVGNKEIETECFKIMRADNQNHLLFIFNCSDASYIRTNEAIKFLSDMLLSDKIMPCSPKKAIFNGEPFASFALRELKKIIVNMPQMSPIEPFCQYTMEEVVKARKWMKANKGKYIIDTENF